MRMATTAGLDPAAAEMMGASEILWMLVSEAAIKVWWRKVAPIL